MSLKALKQRFGSLKKHKSWFFFMVPILAFSMTLGSLGVQLIHISIVQGDAGRPVPLAGSITPWLRHALPDGVPDPQAEISMGLGLKPQRNDELLRYAEEVSRPGSINYRHFLNDEEYNNLFRPEPQTYEIILNYLRSSGFTITQTYEHHLFVSFRGQVQVAERVFHVTLRSYTTHDGYHFFANFTDPTLPARIAGSVLNVYGLSNATHWSHPLNKQYPSALAVAPAQGCPGKKAGYFLPDQLASTYKLDDLYKTQELGDGQSLALFEMAPFSPSDIEHYTKCFGNAQTQINTIAVGKVEFANDDDGILEAELDIEIVLGMIPHLHELRVYQASNISSDYLAEWSRVIDDAVPVVSSSWGACENFIERSVIQQEHNLFALAVVRGQSIFASSGDTGSAGCAYDGVSRNLNVVDPASQPYVTGVGGTSLTIRNDGSPNEVAWNVPPNAINTTGGATGGGVSQYWLQPGWQDGPGVRNSQSSAVSCQAINGKLCRQVPDVALNADPGTGYIAYCTLEPVCTHEKPWLTVGGTSAATPMWAVWATLANQLAQQQGTASLGFLNPLLYQIARDPTLYKASFHDILNGENDYLHFSRGKYPATPGYDLATGLGSYNGYELAKNVIRMANNGSTLRLQTRGRTWYFPVGRVGADEEETLLLHNPSLDQDTHTMFTYLFADRGSLSIQHTALHGMTTQINVNEDTQIRGRNGQSTIIATIVQVQESDPEIVAERETRQGKESQVSLGLSEMLTSYYLGAERNKAEKRPIMMVINPGMKSLTVTFTVDPGSCGEIDKPACQIKRIGIEGQRVQEIDVESLQIPPDAAVRIQADQPIVLELKR